MRPGRAIRDARGVSRILQPFRGLPFIEAGNQVGGATRTAGLQPFRGLPFIEAVQHESSYAR